MIIHERHTKFFCLGLVCLLLAFITANIFTDHQRADSFTAFIIDHNAAIASSLLTQGVDEKVIAAALTSNQTTAAGSEFLNQIGISTDTDLRLLPAIQDFCQSEQTKQLLVNALFIILLLTLVFFYLRRLKQLYNNATSIIDRYTDGDFAAMLPELADGGIFCLFSRINAMATALKAKEDALSQSKEFLKTTAADISHQLKTPLAALSMYNEIILNEPDNQETVIDFAKKSNTALARMEQLIMSLLKITRLDAGNIDFHPQNHSVPDLVHRALENLTARADKEQKTITLNGNDQDCIFCDLEWTREALGNIIKNALDHTQAGDTITVSWQQTPLLCRLTVADTGSGIDAADIHHIFKRFYRSPHSADTQGVGLGLPLVKSIIEGQQGNIRVESAPGKGTAFTVSFPANLTKL